jgi:heme-binding NEAT domain protein
MRHTTTVAAAAVLLLALTGCSSDSSTNDKPPTATASPSPEPTTPPTKTPTASSDPTNTPDTAALEKAVRAYSDAYFATDTKKAHSMMSGRCQATAPIELYGPAVEATVKQYGVHPIKTLTVDQLAGDLARVTYTYAVPALNQKQQPWTREGGEWRYDAC